MLRDLYVFSQKTCLSTEKKHLTAKKSHLSITLAANIRSPRSMGFTIVHRLCVATEHYDP